MSYASSASEDYAALRAGRAAARMKPRVRRVVIRTRCLECGKEIEYKPEGKLVCESCWKKIHEK